MRENAGMWAQRIFTMNGLATKLDLEGVKALDIGCGDRKLPGATGIDRLALPSVDIVHDLDVTPWPIKDGEYNLVFASHYLEHTRDAIATMEEIHRILAPGGKVVIQVPYFRSVDAVNDPTHVRYFSSQTLDYFIKGTKLFDYQYSKAAFTQSGFWYGWPHPSRNPVTRFIKRILQGNHRRYDQYWSLLAPAKCLTWELERADV